MKGNERKREQNAKRNKEKGKRNPYGKKQVQQTKSHFCPSLKDPCTQSLVCYLLALQLYGQTRKICQICSELHSTDGLGCVNVYAVKEV